MNTEHFTRSALQSAKRRPIATIAAVGTGLSAAAVIFLYAMFATNKDLEKVRSAQSSQWQAYQRQTAEVTALRLDLAEVKGQNKSFEMIFRLLTEKPANVNTNR